MALVLKDRVLESSTSTGTGSFTLSGAQTGYQSFSVIGNGNTVYYTIQGKDSSGNLTGEWEVGVGTWSTGNTLSRDTVLESSNSNAKVDFAIGLKDVFCDLPAEKVITTAGTGISITDNTITNTLPDQTVVLTGAGTTTISGTYPSFTITSTGGSGGGDVTGPSSSTDNAIARFDGTTGKLIQNSAVTIGDTGNTVISVTDNTNAALRVTQLGTGNAILVEDSTNSDTNPFVVNAAGNVGIGLTTPIANLHVVGGNGIIVDANYTSDGGINTKTSLGSFKFGTGIGTSTNCWNIYDLTASAERMRITSTGGVSFGSSGTAYGTSGQVLTSAGNAPPTWTTPATGTVTSITAGTGLSGGTITSSGTIAIDSTVATLSGTQTFTNKTITGTKETVYTITDGAAFEIDPANGGIQTITLGASRTPAATNFTAGQSVALMINDGTAYTITWTTVGVVWVGGTAPTLATTGYTVVELWKVGSTIYGAYVGAVA